MSTFTASTVAALINEADNADDALVAAQATAGDRLTAAALATFEALTNKVSARDIAAQLNRGNKDTVSRLAIVGQVFTLEGEYQPEGISPAHVVRSLVNACVAAKVGLPAMRTALATCED